MKTKDLDIKDHHYYPDFDVFLIRGDRPGTGKRLPRSIVGWMQRTNPDKLIETKSFPDIASAMKAFRDIELSRHFPESFMDMKDRQVRKVYDWEDRILSPDYDREIKDPQNTKKLLQRISREMGIRCPKLVWAENRSHSEYDEDSNVIVFGHRSLMPLLHEMAHAIHKQKLEEEDNDNPIHHSPGFVWHAIDLYHRYGGIELDYLVQSAASAGILGPLHVREPEHYIQILTKVPTPPRLIPG